MSSTEERRVRRFYAERLVPAARALRERGVEIFPTGPDDAESWWEAGPSDEEPEFLEIEPEDFAGALEERWSDEGLPELVALAEDLMELSRALEMRDAQSAEVSPFVYVMY